MMNRLVVSVVLHYVAVDVVPYCGNESTGAAHYRIPGRLKFQAVR